MGEEKIYEMSFSKVFGLLIDKAKRKGRNEYEVKLITSYLTGYTIEKIDSLLLTDINYYDFFNESPDSFTKMLNVKGTICKVRIEDIEEPIMRAIRALDKLVDDLAKGKSIDKIREKYDI